MVSHQELKQVTRGYNIVAHGWAGVYNPIPHPLPHSSNTNTTAVPKIIPNARFHTFQLDHHGPTDGPTNGRKIPVILIVIASATIYSKPEQKKYIRLSKIQVHGANVVEQRERSCNATSREFTTHDSRALIIFHLHILGTSQLYDLIHDGWSDDDGDDDGDDEVNSEQR